MAVELLTTTAIKSIKVRPIELFAGEGKGPQVAVTVDARSMGGGYEDPADLRQPPPRSWMPTDGVSGVALAMPAVSSVLSGVSAMQQARAERAQAKRNAFIGKTRACQTAAGIGDQLNSEMATKATVAANRQSLYGGTMPAIREMSRTMCRDARVGVANERQGAADWRMPGRNAMAAKGVVKLQGIVCAGPSLFSSNECRNGSSERDTYFRPGNGWGPAPPQW